MFQQVDLAVAGLVEPPLTYDPVHRCFRRTDRRRTTMVKRSADRAKTPEEMTDEELGHYYAERQPRRKHRWGWPNRPLTSDPTDAVRTQLARQFCGDADDVNGRLRRSFFTQALHEVEEELLGDDGSAVGLMLAGRLVTCWAMTVWVDLELLDQTHKLACLFPAAVRAKAALAESVDRQFRAAVRTWESYTFRTRGCVPSFPESARNRIAQYFNSAGPGAVN
jgi:hypothetical protein